jgi:hypothetical protein
MARYSADGGMMGWDQSTDDKDKKERPRSVGKGFLYTG